MRIADLIHAACSHVELLPSNIKTQQVYRIGNDKEGKLIFDLLIAYGFDAKFYPENGEATLYVTLPKQSRAPSDAAMAEALAYAQSFRALKACVDTIAATPNIESPRYSISFSRTAALDSQFMIHLVSAKKQSAAAPENMPANPSRPAASAAVPASAASPYAKSTEDIFSGPEITRPLGIRKATAVKNNGPDTPWKQFKTYLRGNSLAAAMTLIACILALIVFISLFVVSKAFLCPDFATMKDKSAPWYCGKDYADKVKNKPKN